MLTNKKITAYSKIVAGLPDVPSPAMSPLELKQWFDTAPEEMRVAFNALIDNLLSTATGDSGAESIGIEPIVGVSAANVQNALEQLKLLINDAVAGAIPDGTITPVKLSFDPATQPELDAHAEDNTHTRYAVATGAANTYAITLSPSPSSYFEGMSVRVKINVLNAGASTININGLGAKAIKKASGNDVLAGNLKVGIVYTMTYNGTNFILQGEGGEYGTATVGDVLAPLTIGTEGGVIPGTLTLTGTAVDADVPAGKTYYNTDAKTKRTGTAIAGRRSAQGANLSSGATLTVTGLAFTPSVVLANRAADPVNEWFGVYVGSINGGRGINAKYGSGAVGATNASATVTSGGFSIQMPSSSNATYNWMAIE